MNLTEPNVDRTLNWISKAASTVLSVALVWPVATALASVATIALVIALAVMPARPPKSAPEPSASRLQQMMQAVQDADARVRREHPEQIQPDPQFRGVWDTFRDKDKLVPPGSEQPTESLP